MSTNATQTPLSAGTFLVNKDPSPIMPRLKVEGTIEVEQKNQGNFIVDEGQTLSKELDRWIERTLHPETPPEGKQKYLTLHIEDGKGYERTIYKYDTDMLWPEQDLYAQSQGAKSYLVDQFEMLCNGRVIDPYKSIEDSGIKDGDTIRIFNGDFGFVADENGKIVLKDHPMFRLSPMDAEGNYYGSFEGSCTRKDEVTLILNLLFHPDRHSARVRTRALWKVTVRDVLMALEDWTTVPATAMRPLIYGVRMEMDSLVANSAIQGKVEIDVYGEQLGGAPKPMFENDELLFKPTKDIRSPYRIEVKGLQGNLKGVIYSEGNGTVRSLLAFLEEHTRTFLDCYQGDEYIDPDRGLWLLQATIDKHDVRTIQVEFEERYRMLDYHPSLAFRGHLWATQVRVEVDNLPTHDAMYMPFGAKLSAWVRRRPTYQRPEIYLGGKLLRGDLVIDQLPLTVGNEIRINTRPTADWPRYNGPTCPTRYREEHYEGPEDVENEGYVRIEFKVADSHFIIFSPPILPFRVIIDFVYEEFGVTVALTKSGRCLVDETPFTMSWTGSIKLSAVIVSKEPNGRKLFETMRLFCTFFNGAAVEGGLHGVLSPCSATLDQVIAHQLPTFGRKKIRFLLDGERVSNETEICTLEVGEDDHVDIEPEVVGGGPMNAQGSQDSDPSKDTPTHETPESAQEGRFEQSKDLKRKDPAEGVVAPTMQFGSLGSMSTGQGERVTMALPTRGRSEGTSSFVHTAQAFGMTPSREHAQADPLGHTFIQTEQEQTRGPGHHTRPLQGQPQRGRSQYGYEGKGSHGSTQTSGGYLPPASQMPVAAAEEYYSAASLPRPSVFCGKGVVNFFEKYEAWCNRYKQSSLGRFTNLCFFLSDQDPHNILQYAKKLPSWMRQDYDGVKADLLRTFHEPEDRYAISDLLALAEKQSREEIEDLGTLISFSFQFKEMANTLVKYNKITDQQYRDTFMIGLGRRLRERMLRRSIQTHTRAINPSFEAIEDDARRVFEPDSYYEQFENRQAQEEARQRHPETIPVPIMQVANSKKTDETSVKDLADMFKDMLVNLNQAVIGPHPQRQVVAAPTHGSRYNSWAANNGVTPNPTLGFHGRDNPDRKGISRPVTPSGPPPATPYRGDPARQAIARPVSPAGCHYCGNEGHSRRYCPDFLQHKQEGLVRENAEGKMITPDGQILPWRRGEMKEVVMQYAVAGGPGAYAHKTSTANYHQTNAQEYEWNDYYEEEPYDGDFESYNATVANAEKRRAEDDAQTSRPKRNRSTGPPVNLPSMNPPTGTTRLPTQIVEPDELMNQDTDSGLPKEKKHKYTLMSDMQKKFHTREAVDRVLNHSTVTFTVGEAISLNPDIGRGVTQASARKRTPYFGPLEANSATITDEPDVGPFYTHGLVRIKVRVEGHDLAALLDSGSELDMISPEAAQMCQLPVRYDGDHRVTGIGGPNPTKLAGICENTTVSIGGIKKTLHLFIKPMRYQLLLGMPTIRRFRISTKIDDQGQLCIHLKDNDGIKIRLHAIDQNNSRNRTYLPPNLGKERRFEPVEEEDSDSDSSNE
ncbi:hypothetical protein OC845_006708 [Tilletia horrida]|nr:hypothetical protein OC845_006708 [Tilletia horrida]